MPPPTLTPAQLALQAERKAIKEAKKAAAKAQAGSAQSAPEVAGEQDRSRFLRREWIDHRRQSGVGVNSGDGAVTRIVTWNILAQTLVRRELFPGSDCLRWADRKAMLLAELAHHGAADIICLQECDRLGDLAKALPTHTPVETKGRGKLHGLVVFYRKDRYSVKATRTVYLDEERLSTGKDGREGRGGTRQTKNVGLIVGLQDGQGGGIVVTTTHLFWHPKFAYERVRQSIVLVRAIRRFQREHGCETWPAVLAGDLNTQPSEATYQLLVSPSSPLHAKAIDDVNASRLVHTSLEHVSDAFADEDEGDTSGATGSNTPAPSAAEEKDDEGEGEGELPDHDERSIANTRPPREGDGILEVDELVRLLQHELGQGATSALGSAPSDTSAEGGIRETFGNRGGLDGMSGHGKDEPAYTCYTPLFKLTLDYVFILPSLDTSASSTPEVVGHYRLPQTTELSEGLPRKGICASDHLAVGCGLAW